MFKNNIDEIYLDFNQPSGLRYPPPLLTINTTCPSPSSPLSAVPNTVPACTCVPRDTLMALRLLYAVKYLPCRTTTACALPISKTADTSPSATAFTEVPIGKEIVMPSLLPCSFVFGISYGPK